MQATATAETSAATTAARPIENRRRRGALGGLVVMSVGFAFILPPLGVANASSYLFLALGFAFAIAYVTSMNPYVYLVPASTLTSLGLGLLLPDWLRLGGELASPVFLACLAIGFALAFMIRPNRRWPLVPAATLALVTLAEIFGAGTLIPSALQPFFVPVVLVAVGAYLIFAPRQG
jgi:hypothetical protein